MTETCGNVPITGQKGMSENPLGHANAGHYEALIVGGVWPNQESLVERSLGCFGACLWFRCEGALVWDAYGSLVRSILMMVRRCPSLHTIYVVAQGPSATAGDSTSPSLLRTDLNIGVSEDSLNTITYLLEEVLGVDPLQWWGQLSDPASAVRNTVRILEEHPLMRPSVAVQGFLFEEMGTRLKRLDG